MAAAKKHQVGELVEVKEGTAVTRPDGTELVVTGGLYVLDEPGPHTVGGETLEVK